jgi:UDP-glucose 4-epimerase
MKALVLGGNGFIGFNLVDRLVEEGHKVRVYDRSSLQLHEQKKNVEYKCGSLNDIVSVTQALHEVDVVFHLISSSIPSTSNLSPVDDIKDNLADTVGLLECMKKMSIHRIVYLSSGGTIYGDSKKEIITEEHDLNPNCSYGIVKLAVEKYLSMYARLYQFEPVILRVSNPYGPRQGKAGLQGLIGTVLAKVIKNESVEIWGNGEVIRDYIFVTDLVDACIRAINSNVSGIFNIGSGVGHSVNQIIKYIEELTDKEIQVNYTKAREVDVKKVVLDVGKAKRELEWEAKININEGLKEHYNWMLSL